MKVRIKVRPTGYVSLGGGPLQAWPKVGAVVELPDAVARGLVASGDAEIVRLGKVTEQIATAPAPVVETRPAPPIEVEERTAGTAFDGSGVAVSVPRRRRSRRSSAAQTSEDES